jgi:dipeptidyl aminopeptidase/acylaminoacyl peptidase
MSKKPQALDVDTLWKLGRIGGIALAPDGRRAVCALTRHDMQRNQGRTQLWLMDTTRQQARALTTGGEKDGAPAFSPRGDRIAFIGKREQEGAKDASPQLYVIDLAGGEARRVSHFEPGIESFRWLPDGQRIVFASWVWPDVRGSAAQNRRQRQERERKDSGYATSEALYRFWDHHLPAGRALHLLLLDLKSGRITDIFEGTSLELPRMGNGDGVFDVHPAGDRIAFLHDPAAEPLLGNRLALSELLLGPRRHVRSLVNDARWDIGALRYSPNGEHIAVAAAEVAAHHQAMARLAIVEPGRPFVPPDAASLAWDHEIDSALAWADDGSALYFTAEERGRRHLWRQAVQAGRPVGAPTIEHAGGWVSAFEHAGGCTLLAQESAAHPTQLWARRAGAATRIERFNDAELARVQLGATREVFFKGANGDRIQMWLTFPPGVNPDRPPRKPLAVLHAIHGGPYNASGQAFSWRWNPHVFAGAGRVVAQVNFHGSSGFGYAFKTSLVGRQGAQELQDIEAATDWLHRQPWVDKARIFAGGGSYGGFLVAWMNGHVPYKASAPRYRAYVCHAGVFDRISTFSADSWPVRPKDLGARWWDDMPRVLAQSPHAFAAHMRTPTLVTHGARDFRVPDANGLAYYNTLKALGVDARLLWFADENHWVLKPQNSRQWYGEVAAWLDRHEPHARRR